MTLWYTTAHVEENVTHWKVIFWHTLVQLALREIGKVLIYRQKRFSLLGHYIGWRRMTFIWLLRRFGPLLSGLPSNLNLHLVIQIVTKYKFVKDEEGYYHYESLYSLTQFDIPCLSSQFLHSMPSYGPPLLLLLLVSKIRGCMGLTLVHLWWILPGMPKPWRNVLFDLWKEIYHSQTSSSILLTKDINFFK